MKKFLFLILTIVLFSCSSNDNNTDQPLQTIENKVLLLQVDYITNVLEGAKELVFPEATNDFTITSNFQEPGDFGNISLYYEENSEMIFNGSIVWMGLGVKTFPIGFTVPENLNTIDVPLDFPSDNSFQKVMYSEFSFYPDTLDYETLWSVINNLELVSAYRKSNQNAKINVFLYTPSVGIGEPADWDYFIILKN